jgi:polysaccharide biosynthesis transport protein
MEDEIDLRRYIEILIHNWYWIVGLGAVAAIAAFAVSSLMPPTYEAVSMVAITGPRYEMRFEASIQDVPFNPAQFNQAYATMAKSDAMLRSVADAAGVPTTEGLEAREALEDALTAESEGSELLLLRARSDDPQQAARLANVWAQEMVIELNDLFRTEADTVQLESQLAEAKIALDAADQALTAFRREYGFGFSSVSDVGGRVGIARELETKTSLLAAYESRANQIEQLLQEAQSMQAQAASDSSPAIVAGLLADMLQLSVVGGQPASLVQINLADLDAQESLAALVTVLQAKLASVQASIAQVSAEVEALQAEVADRHQELDHLLRERDLAEATHEVLSRKVQERSMEVDDEVAQVLSEASTPRKPVAPRRLYNTAIAGVLGVMLAVLGVFFADYWRREDATSDDAAGE